MLAGVGRRVSTKVGKDRCHDVGHVVGVSPRGFPVTAHMRFEFVEMIPGMLAQRSLNVMRPLNVPIPRAG